MDGLLLMLVLSLSLILRTAGTGVVVSPPMVGKGGGGAVCL